MTRRSLIANRGEIAVGITRICKEMNIEIVVVCSTADRGTLYVQFADYAVRIGGSRANDSYLSVKNILSAAYMTACDAIHPGFGFLSENAKFVRLALRCSPTFVGPNPDVTRQVGDENNARYRIIEAGVSVIPGSEDLLETVQDATAMVEKIGYLMPIRTSSGGGGRGMRRADCTEELAGTFGTTKAEACVNFGGDTVYMEKFIAEPKHAGVQLMAGKHGNVVHLYEHDCSCQRRNQKLLEEVPCHILEEDAREHLLRDTVRAAESAGYDSMGTIELLLDTCGGYYFVEVNARIQMEHTISEEIYGADLIKRQIRIADGHKLTYRQENIVYRGHAIECRINAGDIKYNFAPSPRQVSFVNFPPGHHVRIESAVYNDYNIPPCYDPMIAKIIAYIDARLECIKWMHSAPGELLIEDVETNIESQYLLPHHPTFVGGRYDTSLMELFIKELKKDGTII